jgi:glycosyltransferase involved in cell wall biosynthesis
MNKVLFFVQLPPPIHGAAVCNQNIVNSKVIARDISVRLLPIKFSNTITEMQKNGVWKLLKIVPLGIKLILEIIFNRPKAVYFTISPIGTSFYRDLLFVSIMKIFGLTIIYHLHGKGIADQTSRIKQTLYRFTFSNTYLVCLSERLSKDVDSVKSNAVVFVCPNGVETLDVVPSNCTATIELLFLSNLLPSKGLYEYLNMAKLLVEKGYDVNINLAGPFNNKFKEVDLNRILTESPELSNRFMYHGSVAGVKKWELLERSDILVHPTRNDAFPLVILEAMASACAVVSTDQGGIPDILECGDFGSVIPVGSEEKLFDSTLKLITDSERLAECQKNARKEYLEKYTMHSFENNILKILKKVTRET